MVLASAGAPGGFAPEVFDARVISKGVTLPLLSSSVAGGVPAIVMVGRMVSGPTPYSDVCSAHVCVLVSSTRNFSTSGRVVSSAYAMSWTLGAVSTGPGGRG